MLRRIPMQPRAPLERSIGRVEMTGASFGDQDASRRAFDAHYDRLFRLALVLAGNSYDAEDIVQDVFMKAGRRLAALPDSDVAPYLRAAVVNEWRSRVRRLRTRMRRGVLLTAPTSQPVDTDAANDLWTYVLELPARQRATVVLRYYEDLSEQDTAEVLGCSVGTVKSQLSRAIEHLRRRYADEDRG
jgi:RNA polymerase sigma-70 factor (sigma-E family)